ncbi:MAG: citramalate synthase [Trueperaceae bacterium]
MATIEIYDTTLRDGTQGLEFNLTVEDKLAIAKRLDAFGMDYIEGGWPGSNPKDMEFFERMKRVKLARSQLAAFGSTRHKDSKVEEDANLQALLQAETPVVTLVAKSWDFHVTEALGATLEQNLAMIEDSVRYLKLKGKTVIHDAEHFFDGYKANPQYALKTLESAVRGGADRLVLCDTNGGTLPEFVAERIRDVKAKFNLPIGIHTHNDSELAVANSLVAIQAGATHVQGTVNGYGERCGNANIISIVANLVLKLGFEQSQDLTKLRELSHYIDERANMQPNVRAAYVSDTAFAHKGGIHVSAVNKNPKTYEHVEPEQVGNKRRVLLSDLSGRANILAKSAEFGESVDAKDSSIKDVLERMKELENQGYAFEGAEASFQLMSKKVRGDYQPYFTLHGFTVMMDKRETDKDVRCDATIKVEVGGQFEHTAADGNGPVNALSEALNKALVRFYPSLSQLTLTDYKVRVLAGSAESGTASVVRVLLETTDGQDTWGTVGASTNIIDASYEALIDAIEYKLVKDKVIPQGQEIKMST